MPLTKSETTEAPVLAKVWRGDFLESVHHGHAVIVSATGEIIKSWGDPNKIILPRSACKMLQAIPLVESGAAEGIGLRSEQIALACASHEAAAMHTKLVVNWLSVLGKADGDLRCGPQDPSDTKAHADLIKRGYLPCQYHNNCSGKHTGMLTLNAHLGGDAEYHDPLHPVQIAICEAFEEMTGEASPGYAIDGCSAPNFATSLKGLARAMANMAAPNDSVRGKACSRIVAAMIDNPLLVAGEGRACSELMAAMDGVAVKTGAEGVFTAIVPARGYGVAVKIDDGATRAAEAVIAKILVQLGLLAENHPAARQRTNAPVLNRSGLKTGQVQAVL